MTCNVFGGTLNLAQSNPLLPVSCRVHTLLSETDIDFTELVFPH